MQMELCANQIDSSVVDRTAQALLDSLSMERLGAFFMGSTV